MHDSPKTSKRNSSFVAHLYQFPYDFNVQNRIKTREFSSRARFTFSPRAPIFIKYRVGILGINQTHANALECEKRWENSRRTALGVSQARHYLTLQELAHQLAIFSADENRIFRRSDRARMRRYKQIVCRVLRHGAKVNTSEFVHRERNEGGRGKKKKKVRTRSNRIFRDKIRRNFVFSVCTERWLGWRFFFPPEFVRTSWWKKKKKRLS